MNNGDKLIYIYAYNTLCILLINTFLINENTSLFLMRMLLEINSLYLKVRYFIIQISSGACFAEIPNKS